MTKEELKRILASDAKGVEIAKALRTYWNIPEDELYNAARSIFINDPTLENGT